MLRLLGSALALIALLGCADVPLVPALDPQALLRDEAFPKPAQAIDASEVFAIDDAMREYLRHARPLMGGSVPVRAARAMPRCISTRG